MRIAVVHTQPLSTREAGVAFVAGAATGLAQAGADVSLLVPRDRGDSREALRKLGAPEPPPFQMPRLPAAGWTIGPFHPTWTERFRRAVVRLVRDEHFDAVIARDLKLAQALCTRGRAAKVIYELHNVYTLG